MGNHNQEARCLQADSDTRKSMLAGPRFEEVGFAHDSALEGIWIRTLGPPSAGTRSGPVQIAGSSPGSRIRLAAAVRQGARGLPRLPSDIARPVVPPQEIGAELIEPRTVDLTHHEVYFAAQYVDRLFDTRKPPCSCAVQRRSSKKHELCAKTQRNQDVAAAPHAAIQHYRHSFANRSLDRRQYVERGRSLVELASAMVGHNDPIAADLSGTQCISWIHNPFDDQRARERPPIVL